MAISDLLRGCPLFFELYDTEIEKIVEKCSVIEFKSGDFIIREGEEGKEIFVILEGTAQIQKQTGKQGENEPIVIQDIQKGDIFGEVVLFDDRTRSADIIARSKCFILEISYENVYGLFKHEPRIFGLMVLNLSRLLAIRLRSTNQIITKLKQSKEATREKRKQAA